LIGAVAGLPSGRLTDGGLRAIGSHPTIAAFDATTYELVGERLATSGRRPVVRRRDLVMTAGGTR
jgi:hypothetical protein